MDIHNNKLYDNFEMTVKFFLGTCLDTMRKEACSNEVNNSLLTQMFIITAMIFDLLKQARNQQIILFLYSLFPKCVNLVQK
jgi:hypothetical protein